MKEYHCPDCGEKQEQEIDWPSNKNDKPTEEVRTFWGESCMQADAVTTR